MVIQVQSIGTEGNTCSLEESPSQSVERPGTQVGDLVAGDPSLTCIQEQATAATHDEIEMVCVETVSLQKVRD